jgi:hypothetical protein
VNLNKNLDLEDQNVSPKEVEHEELLGILT